MPTKAVMTINALLDDVHTLKTLMKLEPTKHSGATAGANGKEEKFYLKATY
jgi:hypothetical protein